MLLYSVGGVFNLAMVLAATANRPLSAGELTGYIASAALITGALYLHGPAVYVRVTEKEVVVANWVFTHRIPRTLVKGVGGYDRLGVDIMLVGGKEVGVGASQPILHAWGSRRYYRGWGRQLELLFQEILPSSSKGSEEYERRLRYSSLAVASAMVGLLLLALLWTIPHSSG
jgi:hypothetical protein